MSSYQQYVQSVQREIKQIDVVSFNNSSSQYDLLIDVREEQELSAGKLINSIHISRGVLEAKLSSLAPKTEDGNPYDWLKRQNIALYCRSGARSALAAQSLQAQGLTRVVSIQGGIDKWIENGLPLANQ